MCYLVTGRGHLRNRGLLLMTGAIVYGRERGYFLIRTSRGVGWLSPDQAGSFHPLETLITRDLTYLTHAWDGFVSASPGSAGRTRVGPQRRLYEKRKRRRPCQRTSDRSRLIVRDFLRLSQQACPQAGAGAVRRRGASKQAFLIAVALAV